MDLDHMLWIWAEIVERIELLNAVVAVAMADGANAGLEMLGKLRLLFGPQRGR